MYYVKEVTNGRLIPIGAASKEETAKDLVSDRVGSSKLRWIPKAGTDNQQIATYKHRTFICEDTSALR